jgi:hypothetical protein
MENGLTDKEQALLTFIATFFFALGTAGATLPNFIPDNLKVPFALTFWILGILGLSLLQALGAQPTPQIPAAPAPATKTT